MHWLNDRQGDLDALLDSALGGDLHVHLGRQGSIRVQDIPVLMTPGTRIENAFGGDGNDTLSGSTTSASLLATAAATC